jgi:hypothetical protein
MNFKFELDWLFYDEHLIFEVEYFLHLRSLIKI